MGLYVNVYRTNGLGDGTNEGISSKHDRLLLINVTGPFYPNKNDDPDTCAILEKGHGSKSVVIRPIENFKLDNEGKVIGYIPCKRWTMFGGNFAHTSDSRFGEAYSEITQTGYATLAIPIHDRIE